MREPLVILPVADLLEGYLLAHRASHCPRTPDLMRAAIGKLFTCFGEDKPADSYTAKDVAMFQAWLVDRGHCNNGINGITIRIGRVFQWAENENHIDRNPWDPRRARRLRRSMIYRVHFTEEQYQRVLRESSNVKKYRPYWPHAIVLGWGTGQRLGDIACLKWEQIRWDDEVLVVRPRKNLAIRQKLEIPIEPAAYECLLHVKNTTEFPNSPYVLPWMHAYYERQLADGTGDTEKACMLSRQFRQICDAVGLPDHSFHSFRHGFVTRLVEHGVDPMIIGELTGQTMRQILDYTHISLTVKRNAMSAARQALHAANLEASGFQLKPAVQL